MELLKSLLGSEQILAMAATFIGSAFLWLRQREWVQKHNAEKVVQCIETAVQQTYDEYVRACKEASFDGKLTDEERVEARKLALEKAVAIAKEQGVSLATNFAESYLPTLIEKVVSTAKGSKS